MKTAIIYNEFESLKYYVLDGDLRKLQGVYINSMESSEKLTDKLNALMYEPETGKEKNTPVTLSEFAQAIRDGAKVIECGFIP